MAKFFYIARNRAGQKQSGAEEAATLDEAVGRLQARDLIVVNIFPEEKSAGAGVMPEIKGGSKFQRRHFGISSDDLVLFCRQIATLLGAGVTILKSLDIVSHQVASRRLYAIIKDLIKNMEAGLSFHEAMAKHPKVFSELWVNLVESGEASGNLAVVLSRLATYLERAAAFKTKMISAMIYPAILLVASIGALIFLSIKIIPTFAILFKGFNIELPLLTKILISFSGFLRKFYWGIILAIAAGAWLFAKYIGTKDGRRAFEKVLFSLPVAGEFFRTLAVERFTSEMATLTESGVPILYSLEIAEHSVGNLTLGDIIGEVKESVREGKSLAGPLEKSGFFEPMAVQMINIGEEIGDLANMFKRLNAFYKDYSETFLARFTAMFEPMILVFMGLIVGLVVIGMFLPIFEIAQIK